MISARRDISFRHLWVMVWIAVMWAVVGWLLWSLNDAAVAQSGCVSVYDPGNGWVIETCAADPQISTTMEVVLNGTSQGQAALLRVYHRSQGGAGSPQVAVIYASGFVRLKQNADPNPAIPFGSSFILGPAYWSDATTYHHNPQLTRLEINTDWLTNGPLRMQAVGANQDFEVAYELTLSPPRDRQTRLHVHQTYTATTNVSVDAAHLAQADGFKLVQVSSMFINESGSCDEGNTACHDSDAARYIDLDQIRQQVSFSDVTPSGFIFNLPNPLGSTWLDALHTNDVSWQGNTPNVRIALDVLPTDHTITAQGWISATTNPNDDNVNFWLHDDGASVQSWTAGQSDEVGYWLMAQDDPPEPWSELDLRSGNTFLDFESSTDCSFVRDSGQVTSGNIQLIDGYSDTAIQLNYDLGSADGNWVQLRCNFDPPLDLSDYDHLQFDWIGDPDAANSIEIGLVNPGSGQDNIFGRGYHHPTHHGWWGQLVVPFSFLDAWRDGTSFDSSQVSAFFISVVKDPVADDGGSGHLALDNVSAVNVISRTVPTEFEVVSGNEVAKTAVFNWLSSQQQPSGLLKSWQEESSCLSYTYDQALALMVFANEGMWDEADAIVNALIAIQNDDGSWYQVHNCGSNPPTAASSNKWEGDIAWTIAALRRYIDLGGSVEQAIFAKNQAADWLVTRIDGSTGCLMIDHTEGTIDAWWAMQAGGLDYIAEMKGLESCLLTYYWDDNMGRFKGGQSWQQPYLDNQTWGAAFLKAVGEEEKAQRALSYARKVLLLPVQGNQLYGFDGQGGPWSVWNEGTAQYVSLGGQGANDLLVELLAQQEMDGSLPGSPDEFSGGGVWTSRWHGVSATSWLYFALMGEPFYQGIFTNYLAIIVAE